MDDRHRSPSQMIIESDPTAIKKESTIRSRFIQAVKTEIALSESLHHHNEGPNDPSLTPIERHNARIHDMLRRDSKILPEEHVIHSFTELVSKAMLAANSAPSETKLPAMTNLKKSRAPKVSRKGEDMSSAKTTRSVAHLHKVTHFSIAEVAGLIRMFHAFTSRSKNPAQMDRQLFREVFQKHFGIMDDLMLDHLFYYFDEDRAGYIGEMEWVINLSIILRGTIQEHIDFCYEVYKLGSGSSSDEAGIKRPQVRTMLQGCFPADHSESSEDDSGHLELVDLVLKKLGRHTLGYITIESFTNAVLANPLNIQALGTCLPDMSRLKTFMALFAEDYDNYRCNYSLPNDSSYKGKKFMVTVRRRKV